ncbi:MAG: ATP-binding protein [Simkaniaceae bacterium]|nr:ATP-binding protein [Candidatus Sacchlamyda saccharinae]
MPEKDIFGRKEEIASFRSILSSKEAEFLALYGRRRVGKTFLVREFFSNKGMYVEITGQKDGELHQQLENFSRQFSKGFYDNIPLQPPKSWKEAFSLLTTHIQKIPKRQKCILFFDELPWLAGRKSGFMQALDFYWNRYWSSSKNLIVIVCGSAASWMLDHLVNAKGGLHNRLTKTILLKPFNLTESSEYLKHRHVNLNTKQFCDIYMTCGGIPYYLKQIEKGKSATQNINRLCFQKDGLLYNEFDRIFPALFNHSEQHFSIIKAIASASSGISREDLLKKTKMASGGTFRKRLHELEAAGFIQAYCPYGFKRKSQFYRLIDEYVLFYLHWIYPIKLKGIEQGKTYWQTKAKTPSVLSWAGYAFEMICLKHVDEIRKSLGLEGIHIEIGSYRYVPKTKSKERGVQIDLLFDREDGVITLCEIKYSQKKLVFDKSMAKQLAEKIDRFEKHFSTTKSVSLAMITMHGIKPTYWAEELVDDEVVFEELIT